MAKIIWALDGEHFSVWEEGDIERLWDIFNGLEVKKHLTLNKQAKFVLIGDDGQRIGELPRKK